jgi:hypothetical protein
MRAGCYSLIQDREACPKFSKNVQVGPIVINALLLAVSEEQLGSNLRGRLVTDNSNCDLRFSRRTPAERCIAMYVTHNWI